LANYNDRFKGKVGESVYSLTIWGIVVHLRNEKKIPPRRIVFFEDKEKSDNPRSSVSDKDLDLMINHFASNFDLISRKWDYLRKSNPGLVYEKLFDMLLLANYYFEVMNAEFELFEKSALDDLYLNFFLPNQILPKYAEKWMSTIVKDNEILDYLIECFEDLGENFKTNQEIIMEYKKALDASRKGRKRKQSKFFKKTDFIATNPVKHRGFVSKSNFVGKGYWGYPLSYFLNNLDFGPINHRTQLSANFRGYRKKRR